MSGSGRRFLFRGGVHPSDGKALSCAEPVKDAPLLERYLVPLQQNIGAPPKPYVKKGDEVRKGQIIAEAGGFVSVPLHSPACGKVGDTLDVPGVAGALVQAIEIIPDGTDEWLSGLEPLAAWQDASPELLKERISAAGIVGMGGASFPTHVKLSPPKGKTIDTLIVNGAECEPYLTADHRVMLEDTEKVLEGAAIFGRILGVSKIFIGVELNKPDAIEALSKLASKWGAEVVPLRVRYPQGAEKQLIYATTGRRTPAGGLPMDVSCVVQNAGTCVAACDAVKLGRPLIERVVTITGTPVVRPGNWRLRIGTPAHKAIELAGGFKAAPAKLILGGPMMGFAQPALDSCVTKNCSGMLALAPGEVSQFVSDPCIRCGRCVDVCPMNLLAGTISVMVECERFEDAERAYVMDCMECGSCAYVCPSKRPLVQHFRRAKAEIVARRRKKA